MPLIYAAVTISATCIIDLCRFMQIKDIHLTNDSLLANTNQQINSGHKTPVTKFRCSLYKKYL